MQCAYSMSTHTIVALATAPIRSALAIIRVSGAESIAITAALIRKAGAIKNASSHTMHYDTIVDDATQKDIDTVIILLYRAPHSYTGEDSVEICCHGNPLIVRAIINLYMRHGAQMAERGEFTIRALLNGKMDLTQAEAVAEVIDAESIGAHQSALARLSGSLGNTIRDIIDRLMQVAAAVHIQLDYPAEESGDIVIDSTNIKYAVDALQTLIESYEIGTLLSNGVSVVFAGRTNSGKSSLFNRLTRKERAIVSAYPGTTRDYLELHMEINGVPIHLFDTAGIRELDATTVSGTVHEIEQEGISRGRDLLHNAHIILYVIDSNIGIAPKEAMYLHTFTHDTRTDTTPMPHVIVLYNKIDMHPTRAGAASIVNADGSTDTTNAHTSSADTYMPITQTARADTMNTQTSSTDTTEPTDTHTSSGTDPTNAHSSSADTTDTMNTHTSSADTTNTDIDNNSGIEIPFPIVRVSAKTGVGIDKLVALLSNIIHPAQLLGSTDASLSLDTRPIIASDRQLHLLQRARKTLISAQAHMRAHIPLDMLVLDIEEAINALGTITGAVTTDDMLDVMFSKFCVGK